MEFTPVPAEKQADIIQPKRAAWFNALLDAGMLKVTARPTLSEAQKQTLEEQGQRMRSRVIDDATYIWVEDIPSDDLAESAPLDDDEVPV